MPLESLDSTLDYDEIRVLKAEATTLYNIASGIPLRKWLEEFIVECSSKLPSHECWLEEGDKGKQHIILRDTEDWQHVLVNLTYEFIDKEQSWFATVKSYELKDKEEPDAYNQAPPGLFANYPYLYQVRITLETLTAINNLWIQKYNLDNKKQAK
jgi:hypothetical protein